MYPSTEQQVAALRDDQRAAFYSRYNTEKKDTSAAVLLALFLGGLGIHEFYLGNAVLGVFFMLFCWTFIPSIIALIQCFGMSSRVRTHNEGIARRILAAFHSQQSIGTLEESGASIKRIEAELHKVEEMLVSGLINQEEYEQLRKKALGL